MDLDSDGYKCVKTSLRSILRKPQTHGPVIEEVVCRANKIVTRALLFLKLYIISTEEGKPVPKVDLNLVVLILKVVSYRTRNYPFKKNGELWVELVNFYNLHFVPQLPLDDEPLPYTRINLLLNYAAKRIVTDFETNIKQHYTDYVGDAVNCYCQKRKYADEFKGQELNNYKKVLENMKADVLNVSPLGPQAWKSDPSYYDDIRHLKDIVLPPNHVFKKDLINYDIKVSPQAYFLPMLKITACLEQEPDPRLRNCIPLRTDVVPKHVTFDTSALINLILAKAEKVGLPKKVRENRDRVWGTIFRTNNRVFRKRGYNFHYMIHTDGVACSLVFDRIGPSRSNTVPTTERYITELTSTEKEHLRGRKVVGIDPNMSDLLYCVDETSTPKNPNTFRYTQNQRRYELRLEKYRKIRQTNKDSTVVEELTVTQWETGLSDYNSKTVDFDKFQDYIWVKLFVNARLAPFYENRLYRKLAFNSYINTQRSEQRLLTRFEEKFGSPDKVVIGFGDWSEGFHRKYKEPVKGVGFRKLFRRGGFTALLVKEFRTSVQCSYCQCEDGKCEKFHGRIDPRTQRYVDKIHGLLKCKTCSRFWNRDVNSALNITLAAREVLDGHDRPAYLRWKGYRPMAVSASLPLSASGSSVVASINSGIFSRYGN